MSHDVLMICYSRSGTTLSVARQLADMTGWPLATVEDVKPRTGLWGDVRSAWDALFTRNTAYRYTGPQPSRYTHVVIMAPIWVGCLAAPMRSFLLDSQTGRLNRNRLPTSVSSICLMASHGAFHAIDDIANLLGHAPWPAVALRERDVLQGMTANVLSTFASDVEKAVKMPQDRPMRPHWLSPHEA